MTEKEKAEIVDKGNNVVDVLMKTLKENMDCNEANTVLLEFVVAKFAASNMLAVQEMTCRADIEEEVFAMIRMLMEILGKDMKIQSLRDKKNELQRKVEDLRKENDDLRKENEKERKKLEERKKIKDELEKKHEELLEKVGNSKKNWN